ncbi:hypothetical protein BDR22DRAFT_884815 [Usnea florida]
MLNLTHVLTYWQRFTNTTWDFAGEHSDPAPRDPSSKYQMLFLIALTATVVFYILDLVESKDRNQKQDNRLAVLEDGMMDLTGRILPLTGTCSLDDDDDFKLPPPAFEIYDGFHED